MKRVLLLSLGALIGLLLVAAYVMLRNALTGLPEGDTFATQAFLFECCVIFIAALYNTGAIGYRLLGDSRESRKIKSYSRKHMLILNMLGLALFILGIVFE